MSEQELIAQLKADKTITDPRQRAYVLATVKHETANTFEPIAEHGVLSYFDKYNAGTAIGARLGNTQKNDGFRYRGRGFVQITGRGNYVKFSKLLPPIDFVNYPDLALDPGIAYRITVYGMVSGVFTGKNLGDYINEKLCDFVGARHIINGNDQAALIAGYATSYMQRGVFS